MRFSNGRLLSACLLSRPGREIQSREGCVHRAGPRAAGAALPATVAGPAGYSTQVSAGQVGEAERRSTQLRSTALRCARGRRGGRCGAAPRCAQGGRGGAAPTCRVQGHHRLALCAGADEVVVLDHPRSACCFCGGGRQPGGGAEGRCVCACSCSPSRCDRRLRGAARPTATDFGDQADPRTRLRVRPGCPAGRTCWHAASPATQQSGLAGLSAATQPKHCTKHDINPPGRPPRNQSTRSTPGSRCWSGWRSAQWAAPGGSVEAIVCVCGARASARHPLNPACPCACRAGVGWGGGGGSHCQARHWQRVAPQLLLAEARRLCKRCKARAPGVHGLFCG